MSWGGGTSPLSSSPALRSFSTWGGEIVQLACDEGRFHALHEVLVMGEVVIDQRRLERLLHPGKQRRALLLGKRRRRAEQLGAFFVIGAGIDPKHKHHGPGAAEACAC